MIILISGASHTGKTLLAQKLSEKYKYPYLSVDLLKMGLIRSKNTDLTPEDDDKLTDYLWPILREIVKTAVENGQNLIVEGVNIPFDWKKDFSPDHLEQIRFICLVMSRDCMTGHFSDIKKYAGGIVHRLDDSDCTVETLLEDNLRCLDGCQRYNGRYILIDGEYRVDPVF